MTDPNAIPSAPSTSLPAGVVDITSLAETMRSSFVTWGTAYVFGLEVAIPGMEWVATPIIADLDKAIVKGVLDLLSKAAIMEAFFINTAIRKASQAKDYIDAVEAKNALPPTATTEEYANAEKQEMASFRNFVMVTN